ncbi:EamA family transporter [Gemmobacter lanyuensis]
MVSFVAYTSYYLALVALPLADTIALYFSAPLMIVALSVVMLGERVSLPRWIAVLVGFGGVVIMVRPGSSMFDGAALLAVGSGLAYALSMILARIQGGSRSAAVLAFHGNAVFLIGALLLAAVFGGGQFAGDGHPSLQFMTRAWVMPSPTDALLMASCGVIAALGLTLITQAYRIAPLRPWRPSNIRS